MKLPNILMTTAAIFAVLAGIVWTINRSLPPARYDLHDRMREASQPTGDVMQVQLAHVGHIDTPDGRFEVVAQLNVLTGMLAARGQQRMLLFTPSGELVKEYYMPMGQPLWCEGSRIYLDGGTNTGAFRMDPVIEAEEPEDSMPTGNILDFSAGFADPVITEDARHAAERRAEINRYNASLLTH